VKLDIIDSVDGRKKLDVAPNVAPKKYKNLPDRFSRRVLPPTPFFNSFDPSGR